MPLLHALKDVTSPYAAFGLVVVALAIVSFYTSISGLIKAEMFPPEVRALGVGLSYAVANAIFGGSAEYVALWLKSIGSRVDVLLVRHRDVRDCRASCRCVCAIRRRKGICVTSLEPVTCA